MIGNKVKLPGVPEPSFSQFGEIIKGDAVVYYATRDSVVLGIFKTISDKIYLKKDPLWGEMVALKIKSIELPPSGFYLDLKELLSDPSISLDVFPQKERWGSYIQGRVCRPLSEKDFQVFEKAMTERRYLKSSQSLE